MQLEAGAIGLTVATIGEAEAFAEAGVTEFVATPVGRRRQVEAAGRPG